MWQKREREKKLLTDVVMLRAFSVLCQQQQKKCFRIEHVVSYVDVYASCIAIQSAYSHVKKSVHFQVSLYTVRKTSQEIFSLICVKLLSSPTWLQIGLLVCRTHTSVSLSTQITAGDALSKHSLDFHMARYA